MAVEGARPDSVRVAAPSVTLRAPPPGDCVAGEEEKDYFSLIRSSAILPSRTVSVNRPVPEKKLLFQSVSKAIIPFASLIIFVIVSVPWRRSSRDRSSP